MSVDFAALERAYGLPPGYLHRTMMLESGGRLDARNPNSSAKGPFQFIDSTARQYGLEDRTDLAAAADAAARLARDNMQHLRRVLGRDPSAAELYLAHQQGGGGAARLLGNPDAMASDIVGEAAARLNAGRPGQTAGDFAQHWLNRFDRQAQQAVQPGLSTGQTQAGILPVNSEPSLGGIFSQPVMQGLLDAYKGSVPEMRPHQMSPRQAAGYTPQRRDHVTPLLQFFQSMRA